MYATTTTGHREHVQKSIDSRVILAMHISGTDARVTQTTTTTTEEWLGLSYSDAETLCTASENLGGVKLTVSSGGVSAWNTVEGCRGTRVSTQISRMGDTNHYRVVKTTQEMVCANTGGTMELI